MSTPSSLAFVGAGSLGQAFAGLLATSGQAVTLVATLSSRERLLQAERIRLRGALDLEIPVEAAPAPAGRVGITADPGDLPSNTGVIFTTKSHQLPAAIAMVRAVWPRADDATSWVAGVQNGIIKDDLLVKAFGVERVVGAVTILGAQREADGGVTVTSRGATYLGEFAGDSSPRVAAAAQTLRAAGIPTEAVTDIQSVLWSKVCNAVGVFGVCVLTRSSGSRMSSNPDLMRAYHALIRETATVAAAYGVTIGDYEGFPIRSYLTKSETKMIASAASRAATFAGESGAGGTESFPSMVQDLLAGRPMESDQIFGDVVRRAEYVGITVPRIALVRDLIAGLNRTTSHR
ncbi:MAG TPA: 2-dehydropantoate 2-reductase [Chloroflexota bacterium]|nr:2-dehydropantoate 2-reductase [Chloroflexota bacterium]